MKLFISQCVEAAELQIGQTVVNVSGFLCVTVRAYW